MCLVHHIVSYCVSSPRARFANCVFFDDCGRHYHCDCWTCILYGGFATWFDATW